LLFWNGLGRLTNWQSTWRKCAKWTVHLDAFHSIKEIKKAKFSAIPAFSWRNCTTARFFLPHFAPLCAISNEGYR